MGFWAAMDEVYPQTRHQRCWVHKTANILNSLPKSSQPKAKEAIHEIWQAETKINAEKAFERNYSGTQLIDITCYFLIIFTVYPKGP